MDWPVTQSFFSKPGDVLPYSELSCTGVVNRSSVFFLAKFLYFLTKKLGFFFKSVNSTEFANFCLLFNMKKLRKNTLNMSWTPLEVSLVCMLTLWVTIKKPKVWLTPVGARESSFCAKCTGFYCVCGNVLLGWSFLSAVDTQKLFSMFVFQARLCMFLKVVYICIS